MSKLKKRIEFPVEVLREILDYDPELGELTWKVRKLDSEWWSPSGAKCFNTQRSGKVAGFNKPIKNRDYVRKEMKLPDGKNYICHRVIWAWMTGEWPTCLVDHIDQDPTNNRWDNLREVDYHGNQQNVRLRSDNAAGYVGVYWNKRTACWVSQTTFKGEKLIEESSTLLDAVAARIRQQKHFKFSESHGKPKNDV